ncbi:MAG: nucleotidyltransferase family protein [Aliiglaciecola sp.]
MKVAMILAAGRGERMKPLTDQTPKPLLTVKGIPLIEHHLNKLALAGFTHVVINVAWLGEQIIHALGDGSRFNLKIHFSDEKEALETAGGIVNALPILLPLLEQHQEFAVINADIFTDFDFSALPTNLEDKLGHLILVDNPVHNPNGDFSLKGSEMHRLKKNQFTFSGIAVYHKEMFSSLIAEKSALAPLLFEKVAQNRLSGQLHNGFWFDVGTPQRLDYLNQMEI